MKTSDGRRPSDATRSARVFWGLALAGGFASQTGCGREFYREWANQDVSEAVYEKTRDPRWRVDLFSIEPPAMSRYANPYDPDRPPAPPDDFATQELSPVPQWPDNRLLVPVEGTAYLEMMEGWQRGRSDPGNGLGILAMPRPDAPVDNTAGPATSPDPAGNPPDLPKPPEAGSTSPFNRPNTADPTAAPPIGMDPAPEVDDPAVKPKPGTNPPPLSPIQRPGAPGGNAPAPGNPPAGPTTGIPKYDLGTRMAAFRGTGLPMPAPTPDPRPDAEVRRAQNPATPPIGMDPKPGDDDLTKPGNVRPDQTPEEYAAGEKAGGELAGILVPGAIDFDEAEAAGFPQKTRPYVLAIDQSFMLALINSRVYQFQIEQLYGAALAVTLSRFAFTPQFYAGLSPITGVPSGAAAGAGFPAPTLANTFTYQTQETGTPLSSLQLGTVAGFGKAFSAGGRLLAGFANQIVFNFIGHNSIQPSVHSYLPLNLFQPFLRGAGRAVTLEPLTTSERNLVYQARIFAQFRQQFTVVTLIGGTIAQGGSTVNLAGFTAGGNTDPTIGFLNLLEDVQILENNRRNIAAFEQLVTVYTELIKGESSGLSALQLDQTRSGLQGARASLVSARTTYRNDLNNFAAQMGLPPGTPMIPDRSLTRGFKASFDGIEKWQGDPRRKLEDLPLFVEMLPKLQDTILDGRSSLGIYGIDPETNEFKANEDGLEDLLLTAERTALEHRLDLMNARGALYDAWRQIKVAANALLGYLNVTLTNSFLTPPNNNNPFGFNEQAKTFSLAIQAELPLVRVAERNNFRTALINYERTRRSLMSTEDFTKNQVRQDMRSMHLQYLTYEINKRNFVLTIRLRDQAFEQIVAPPAAAAGGNQAPLQTTNLVSFQSQLLGIENQLVTSWYQFQLARLQLYRDLGTLPIDEWEAFHAIFPDQPLTAVNLDPPGRGPGGAGGAADAPFAGLGAPEAARR